jgi:hypothetical protein
MRALRKVANRTVTSVRLILYFLAPSRFFLAPLIIVLLLAGLLLLASGGLGLVAPFGYTLF